MRRIRKYAAILTVSAILLLIGRACYVQRDSHRPTSGTAKTVAELREQTPIDDYFSESELSSIPEMGPFHWQRSGKRYRITGKPDDPRELADWFAHGNPEETAELLNFIDPDAEVIGMGRISSIHSVDFLSDGSFQIGFSPLVLNEEETKLLGFVSDPIAIGLFVIFAACLTVLVRTIRRKPD